MAGVCGGFNAADDLNWQADVRFLLKTEETSQPINFAVKEEVYGIMREALANAFIHANPSTVQIVIRYSDEFRVECSDDGIGIDPAVLERGGVDGHWGLQGMRERAKRIAAQFEIRPRQGGGTTVEIALSGRRAYMSSQRGKRNRFLDLVRRTIFLEH